jgi:hypothetical protein
MGAVKKIKEKIIRWRRFTRTTSIPGNELSTRQIEEAKGNRMSVRKDRR